MAFAYHIWTHNYYHLPSLPMIAISLSPTIAALERWAQRKNILKPVLIALVCVGIIFTTYGTIKSIQFFLSEDYRQTRILFSEIDTALDNAPKGPLVALTPDYETSLRFYALRSASHWPSTADQTYRALQGSEIDAFQTLWEQYGGSSYFLITDFKELENQPALQGELSTYPILVQGNGYIIYQLQP
jgi:hypothetical protein